MKGGIKGGFSLIEKLLLRVRMNVAAERRAGTLNPVKNLVLESYSNIFSL